MNLRLEYADLRMCPFCDALLQRLGHYATFGGEEHFFSEAGRDYPEHEVKPDAPGAEPRQRPTRTTHDKLGRERTSGGDVYHVRPYPWLCTRHSTLEDPRPECGLIPDGLARPFHGDVPEWACVGEGEFTVPRNLAEPDHTHGKTTTRVGESF